MNRIKKNILGFCILTALLSIISCEFHTSPTVVDERRDTTLLDLFYGMEKHYSSTGHRGCVLDSIPGVLNLDIESNWITYGIDGENPYQYNCSFCVYVDSIFPTQAVADKVSHILESLIDIYFVGYFLEEGEIPIISDPVSTGHDILCNASKRFSSLDSSRRISADQDTLPSIFAFRTSFVAFKVFGNDSISTYLFESSVDYHASSGCPSSAIYYTLNNKTGNILKYRDIVGEDKDSLVYSLQYEEYCKEFKKKEGPDYTPTHDVKSFEEVTKDNCAIVKEGVLFYYPPYEIGSGAEGQYNLIIKI